MLVEPYAAGDTVRDHAGRCVVILIAPAGFLLLVAEVATTPSSRDEWMWQNPALPAIRHEVAVVNRQPDIVPVMT